MWTRPAGARCSCVGCGALTLVLWFVPEYLGSGDFLRAAVARARAEPGLGGVRRASRSLETFRRSELGADAAAAARRGDRARARVARARPRPARRSAAIAARADGRRGGDDAGRLRRQPALRRAARRARLRARRRGLGRPRARRRRAAAGAPRRSRSRCVAARRSRRRSWPPTSTSSPTTSTSCGPSPSSTTGCRRSSPRRAARTRCCAAARCTRRRSRSRRSPGRCTCTPREVGIFAAPPGTALAGHFSALGARSALPRDRQEPALVSWAATAAERPPNLMRMATYASRPAWELRARAVSSARIAAPLGLGALLALSVLLRTRELGVGFWIDEGLSVGIADRPLGDIPGVLRQDGSPPLYYVLLHVWIALAGTSEEAVHALSVLFARALRPGRVLGRPDAVRPPHGLGRGAAGGGQPVPDPVRAGGADVRARRPARAGQRRPAGCRRSRPTRRTARVRRAPAIGFARRVRGDALHAQLGAVLRRGDGVAWLVALLARARAASARGCCAPALLALRRRACCSTCPGSRHTLYQAAHTGAPWSKAPTLGGARVGARRGCSARSPRSRVLLAARRGPARAAARRATRADRAVVTLLRSSRSGRSCSPGSPRSSRRRGPNRYLAVGVGAVPAARRGRLRPRRPARARRRSRSSPCCGRSTARRREKSNVRDVASAIAPSLRPGDLVVSTQPEQVPVLRLLPAAGPALRDAHRARSPDPGVTDWRDGVERLQRDVGRARPRAAARHARARPAAGARRAARSTSLGRWSAPWTELVRLRSEEWLQYVVQRRAARRSRASSRRSSSAASPNPVRATVYLKR